MAENYLIFDGIFVITDMNVITQKNMLIYTFYEVTMSLDIDESYAYFLTLVIEAVL